MVKMRKGVIMKPRKFYIHRRLHGPADRGPWISGIGLVAEGVVLPNGLVVAWMLVEPYTVLTFPSFNEMKHNIKTSLLLDEKSVII